MVLCWVQHPSRSTLCHCGGISFFSSPEPNKRETWTKDFLKQRQTAIKARRTGGAGGNQKDTRRNETKQGPERVSGWQVSLSWRCLRMSPANCVRGASTLPRPPLRTSPVVCFGVYFKPVPLHLLRGTLRNTPMPVNFDQHLPAHPSDSQWLFF